MKELTEKEKLVFYGLVRWPELNDVQLSEKLDAKRPTVTAIRNKLEKSKLVTTIRIPDLSRLNYNMIMVKYGDFNPLTPYETRTNSIKPIDSDNIFLDITSNDHSVTLSAASDFTEITKYIEETEKKYSQHDFLTDRGNTYLFFPLSLTKKFRFFDFDLLLREHFNLELKEEDVKVDSKTSSTKGKPLSPNEKRILYALVKYPDLTDNRIAKKVSLTRQSVHNTRKRFEREGLIKKVRIPDLKSLGFELLVFTHTKYNPQTPIKERMKGINKIITQGPQFFVISKNLESIRFSAFRNYTDFRRSYQKYISYYKENGFILDNPVIRIFPLSDVKSFIMDRYAPLVKSTLKK